MLDKELFTTEVIDKRSTPCLPRNIYCLDWVNSVLNNHYVKSISELELKPEAASHEGLNFGSANSPRLTLSQ